MVFAQGGVPQQHVTSNDMPSPDTDVQRNDLAPDASLSLTDDDHGRNMGSITGWQALANEVGHTTGPSASKAGLQAKPWPLHLSAIHVVLQWTTTSRAYPTWNWFS